MESILPKFLPTQAQGCMNSATTLSTSTIYYYLLYHPIFLIVRDQSIPIFQVSKTQINHNKSKPPARKKEEHPYPLSLSLSNHMRRSKNIAVDQTTWRHGGAEGNDGPAAAGAASAETDRGGGRRGGDGEVGARGAGEGAGRAGCERHGWGWGLVGERSREGETGRRRKEEEDDDDEKEEERKDLVVSGPPGLLESFWAPPLYPGFLFWSTIWERLLLAV